jgi:hypothetical protein
MVILKLLGKDGVVFEDIVSIMQRFKLIWVKKIEATNV